MTKWYREMRVYERFGMAESAKQMNCEVVEWVRHGLSMWKECKKGNLQEKSMIV